MLNNFRKYNIFTLFSTFSRGMIEVFIPIYLYQLGFSLQQVFIYFFMMLLISLIICIPIGYIGKKFKYKWLILSSALFFGLTYYVLFSITVNFWNLLVLALVYSLYRRCYWISRRYFALEVIPTENMANKVSIVVVMTQTALLFSSYVGALLLNNLPHTYILFISVSIFVVSCIPLITIKEKDNKEPIEFNNSILKKIPLKNLITMILYEFRYITTFIFPIYLYLYVETNYEYIGLFNLFVGISSMIFIYFFSKKMDKDKYDYIVLSGVLLATTLILKLNCTIASIVLIIGLFEGIFSKMYHVGYTRNIYYFGTHYNKISYNILFETIQNTSRLLLFGLILLFTYDLKTMIYICIAGTLINAFIKFDDGKGGYE